MFLVFQKYKISKSNYTFALISKYSIMSREVKQFSKKENNQVSRKVRLWKGKTMSLETFMVIILLAGTFILFANSLRNEILIGWDDGEYLTNPDVAKSGAGSGASIFRSFHLGMYQPLAVLSFAFNYQVFGESSSTFILINLLLHLINIWLVYKLMLKWLKRFEPAFLVALLFAVHPMHVEGVVWISVRSSLMYSAFFLAGLLQYEKYLESKKTGSYLLTLMWFVLALFSKSMAATFPLILILADYLKRRKFTLKVFSEKIPFFILSIIFGLVAIKASASFGHITVLEQDYSFPERIILILYGISFYLFKLILPVNLSAIYAFPHATNGSLPLWVFWPMVMLFIWIIIVWKAKENKHLFVFGSLFFLLSISMVLPLFWSRIFITADRYTYLPYLGLFIIPAIVLTDVWDNRITLQSSTRKMLYSSVILIFILIISSTWNRISVWRDVPTLLNDVIDNRRSDADMAHGYFYLGNFNDTKGDDEEAMKYYDLALSRNTGYLLAYNNRGILKGKHGNIQGAITDFSEAIKLKHDYAEAYYNRGVAYYQQQKPDEACKDWRKASSLGFKQANSVISQYCFKQVAPRF